LPSLTKVSPYHSTGGAAKSKIYTESLLFSGLGFDIKSGSHLADCNTDDFPFPNNFTSKLCCYYAATSPIFTIVEICSNGADDDGDRFIDPVVHSPGSKNEM
jgi:hypothetical protein